MSNLPCSTLVMCLADPSGNPRPNRVIHLLANHGFSVDVLSYPPSGGLPARTSFPIKPPSRNYLQRVARRFRYAIQRLFQYLVISNSINDFFNDLDSGVFPYRKSLNQHKYSLLVVEDLQLLPLAFRIKGPARILFDAREYYPRQAEHSLFFNIFERRERIRLCRKNLPLCDEMITVSPGLADEYQREFQVTPTVIMSTPKYYELTPKETNPRRIRMVHHGGANRNRKLENMIDIAKLLDDRFTLDFYLCSNPSYIDWLKKYASGLSNVRFFDPVPFDKIIPMLSDYDIGLYYLEPRGFNITFNLPNKLFEFIQARLMVAIGPSLDMEAIVRQHECGVVAEAFSVQAMADALNDSMYERLMRSSKEQMKLRKRFVMNEKDGKCLMLLITSRD